MVSRAITSASRPNLNTSPTGRPKSSAVQEMINEVQLPFRSFLEHRDQIRAKMQAPPIVEPHVGIAVFEGWADGLLNDVDLQRRLAAFHEDIRSCRVCSENLEFYKARRKTRP